MFVSRMLPSWKGREAEGPSSPEVAASGDSRWLDAPLPIERGSFDAQISELAGQLNAGHARFLELVAELDREGVWSRQEGCLSAAHYLAWRCGFTPGAAKEQVTLARNLEALPLVRAAFGEGRLSLHQVKALARIAEPATEQTLLDVALGASGAQITQIASRYRRARRLQAESEEECRREYYYRSFYDEDGSYVLHGRLATEQGALIDTALEASRKTLRDAGDDLAPGAELVQMAEASLAAPQAQRDGGDRYQVVVHTDLATLTGRDGSLGETAQGVGLLPETIARLGCDCSIVTMIEDDKGELLSVGDKTRQIPRRLRRALKWRDKHCRWPGCHNPLTDAHHLVRFPLGPTALHNLRLYCRTHHRMLHEGGCSLERDEHGNEIIVNRYGVVVASVQAQPSSATALVRSNAAAGAHIGVANSLPGWGGEAMDYNYVADSLLLERDFALKEWALRAERSPPVEE